MMPPASPNTPPGAAPAPMTPEQLVAFERRRRARNWAVMLALIGLVALVYLVAMARLTRG